MHTDLMLDVRDYLPLGKRFDLEFDAAFGMMMHFNDFDYDNEHYFSTRLGISGNLMLGLDYKLDDDARLGMRLVFPYSGSLFGNLPDVPADMVANTKTQFTGYSLQLHYSIRF